MPAFQSCVDLGYRYVETDVHCTNDGRLVAFHDDTLDRVSDSTGRISTQSWDTIRQIRVSGERIPLLEEILETWPDLHVNIDPKSDDAVAPLIELIQRTGSIDRVCIGSFSDGRIQRLRRALGPSLCTSMGPLEVLRLRLKSYGVPTGRFFSGCAQVPVRQGLVPVVDRRSVQTAHRLGLQVHVWTVDAEEEMHRLLDLGVDGLITDRPSLLKQVLVARGEW